MFVSDESVNAQMLMGNLNDLVQVHHELVAGYEAAIPRLDTRAYQKVFGDFKADHFTCLEVLAKLIEDYGGQVRPRSDAAELLARARVALGKLLNDEGVLQAMQIHEQKLDLEYVRDIASLTAIPGLKPVLKSNRANNAKRLGWFEGEIHMLGHTRHKESRNEGIHKKGSDTKVPPSR